ncbi:hypothetical protein Tco_1226855 [Tanacetum coccineum]
MQTQESKINTGKAVNTNLVVTKSSGTKSKVQDDNSRSGNDTDADDADIRPIYNEEPMAKEKVFAIAALKNDLRKLKGNGVDAKFAKTSVLGKPILQSLKNQSVVRQPNAFKSERPQMLKQRFASQVDANKNLSRRVTQHCFPKRRESVFAKPDHMIASSVSRNSSKNMSRFSSNDMVHNHYLDEARKKTQERDRNSKTSVMPFTRFQSIADGSKPKPRSTNHSTRILPVSKSSCATIAVVPIPDHSKNSNSFSDSKHFVCCITHRRVFNVNHDACITKFLKEVNPSAMSQSNKTINNIKPVEQKSHTQKPVRQIFTGHRFSPNKTSAVYEKTSPRSDLRWKPTSRILKTVGLRGVKDWYQELKTIMANIPPPDHAMDLPVDEPIHPEPAPAIILDHAPVQLEGHANKNVEEEDPEEGPEENKLVPKPNNMNGFAVHMIPQLERNMNGCLVKDDKEEEEEEEKDDEEMNEGGEENDDDDDAEIINHYEEADPLNKPPPTSDDEFEFAPPVVHVADDNGVLVPLVIQFGGNYHIRESLSTWALLASNS